MTFEEKKPVSFTSFHYERYLEDSKQYLPYDITTGLQLDNVCKVFFPKEWDGIYVSDTIPTFSGKTKYCIINTDSSFGPGEHWCAAAYISDYKDEKPFIIAYDSYGRAIQQLIPMLKKKNKCPIINTDKDAEQGLNDDLLNGYVESNCGSRCVAFLLTLHNNGIQEALSI